MSKELLAQYGEAMPLSRRLPPSKRYLDQGKDTQRLAAAVNGKGKCDGVVSKLEWQMDIRAP